jgi:hypothetical protein
MDHDQIHPWTTKPPNIEYKTFLKKFQNDIYKLMKVCNQFVCNSTCYKTNIDALKSLCKYGFLQPLINETHFDIDIGLLHINFFTNGQLMQIH